MTTPSPSTTRMPIHTSDSRHFKRLWLDHGGFIFHVNRTGEVRYEHPWIVRGIRANDRRKDVPAKLISQLNQVIRMEAANDEKA